MGKPLLGGTNAKKIFATMNNLNTEQLKTLSRMIDAYLEGNTDAAIANLGEAMRINAVMTDILQALERGDHHAAFAVQDKIRRALLAHTNGGR